MRLDLEKLNFVLLLAVLLLPIWIFPYFPTQDGPAHVDNAAALRYYFQGAENLWHKYYVLNLRLVPNWFTNVVIAGLMGFVSPIVAEKILISGYIVLLPISIRYSLGAVNPASTFLSILAFLLVYNDILHRGFYNFLFSIPVFFFVIGYWLRHHSSWRRREIICFASLVLLLYFCHAVALVVLVTVLFILALSLGADVAWLNSGNLSSVLRGSWRLFCNRIWISLFLGLTPACLLAGRFVLKQGSPPIWPDYSWKFFAWPLYGVVATTNNPEHLLASTGVSLVFIGLLIYSIRQRVARQTTCLWNGLFFAVVGTCVLYLVAPYSMSGGTIISPRFILFALSLSILLFGTQQFSGRAKFTIGAIVAGVIVLQTALNLPVYARINRDATEYISGSAVIAQNSTLVALCFAIEGCGRGKGPGHLRIVPFTHFSGYLSAERHSVNLYVIDPHTNYFPIKYRDVLDSYPYVHPSLSDSKIVWGEKIAKYAEQTSGRIDYVLLWQLSDAWRVGDDPTPLLRWLSANYELVFTSAMGRLQVYRRKEVSTTMTSDFESFLP